MLKKVSVEIRNLSIVNKLRINRKSSISDDAKGAGRYCLNDISLKLESGDKVLLVDPTHVSKLTLVRALSGMLPPSTGSIAIQGDVFPGTSSNFGVMPRYTLYQNIKLRLMRLGYFHDELTDKCEKALSNSVLSKNADVVYGELGNEVQVIFLIEMMSLLEPSILFLESWMNSSSEEVNARCIDLFKELVMGADIAVIANDNKRLTDGVCTHELIFDAGSVVSFEKVTSL